MKVLVTGGAGFIGANLCRELLVRGHDVVVLDDLSTGLRSNLDGIGVRLRVASVLHAGELASACRGVDSIVHLAAVPSVTRSLENPRRSHDAIATGTVAVLDAAREIGAHVLVASSSSVYGSNPVLPRSEDAVCMPSSPYAASKLAAESYTIAYRASFGLESLAFRFFNVFGPFQLAHHAYAAVVPKFIRAVLSGEPVTVHGDGEQSRDFTFVDSVVEVLADGVSRRITSDTPVNLAFGTRTTVNELVALLARVLDRPIEVAFAPPRTGDVRDSQAAGASMRRLFPLVEPVSLEAGLRRTVAWMQRSAQPLPASAGRPA